MYHFSDEDNEAIDAAVDNLARIREENGGRVPHGFFQVMLYVLVSGLDIPVNQNVLRGRLRKLQKEKYLEQQLQLHRQRFCPIPTLISCRCRAMHWNDSTSDDHEDDDGDDDDDTVISDLTPVNFANAETTRPPTPSPPTLSPPTPPKTTILPPILTKPRAVAISDASGSHDTCHGPSSSVSPAGTTATPPPQKASRLVKPKTRLLQRKSRRLREKRDEPYTAKLRSRTQPRRTQRTVK